MAHLQAGGGSEQLPQVAGPPHNPAHGSHAGQRDELPGWQCGCHPVARGRARCAC